MTSVSRLSLFFVLAVSAAACGGGGSSSGNSPQGSGGAPGSGGGGSRAGSGGQPGTGGSVTGTGGNVTGTGGAVTGTGGSGTGGTVAGTGGTMAGTGGGAGDAGSDGNNMPPPLIGKAFVYAAGFEGGSTLTTFAFDLSNGMLTRMGAGTAGGSSPDYVAMHPGGKILFVNNEVEAGRATAFAIGADGALSKLNDQPSGGGGPAHIWAHTSGKWVLSANYNDGKVAALPVAEDGKLGAPASTQTAGGNAHMVLDDGQSGGFVFVPCASAGHVAMYKFDLGTGQLTPNSPPTIANGQRPRHMAFNPNGKWAYLTHEARTAITTFAYDATTGLLSNAKDTTAPNDGAHVVVHPSGTFVFHIARGGSTLTSYKVGDDGSLTSAGSVSTASPYDGTITKDGKYLIVVGGTSVRVFSINQTTGALTAAGTGTTLQRSQGVAVTVL
jgi:6-phosphogluconolactonase